MTQPTWTADALKNERKSLGRTKFLLAGGLIAAAILLLVVQAIRSESQYFITIDEYHADSAKYASRDFRVSGYVLGDSIQFDQIDAQTSTLAFDVVDDLENPTTTLRVVAHNQPLPDLLRDEAQAIVEGRVDGSGNMVANRDGLLLKCPTRYESGEVDA